jgi:hypothetical protein
MAEPCFSQIDVAMGGADWKANVQIKDDDVRHFTLSSQEPQILLVSLTVTTVPFLRYPEKVTVS